MQRSDRIKSSIKSSLPKSIAHHGKTSLAIEREKFETAQTTSLAKAVNTLETATKEKHVRVLILGTHQDHSAQFFWYLVVTQLQLQAHPVTAWKFCHVLHKILRDGYPTVLKESLKYRPQITELGKLWRHLKEGYGRLIAFYTRLLLQKMKFHEKYPEFPGTLLIGDEAFYKLVANDVNIYFEVAVDMLDYMDDILYMQKAVFSSLDMSRAISTTDSGQCRLAPLIPCIQDSCQLYDYIVRVLFKLHQALPPDTLQGHRLRFQQQFKELKLFYEQAGSLQYFKYLIQIPHLPARAPDFLEISNLSSHVKPVAVVPDEEEEEEEEEEEMHEEVLVDMSAPANTVVAAARASPTPDERDLVISRLMQEISQLKQQLQRVREEDGLIIDSLRSHMSELEQELQELRQIAESTQEENETLRTLLKEEQKHSVDIEKVVLMEKVAKANDDKFKKMKGVYTSLREEHVQLLRTQADLKKQMTKLQCEKSAQETSNKELEEKLMIIDGQKCEIEERLRKEGRNSEERMQQASSEQDTLYNQKQQLEEELANINHEKTDLTLTLTTLQQQLEQEHNEKQQQNLQFQELQEKLNTLQLQHTQLQESQQANQSKVQQQLLQSSSEQDSLRKEKQTLEGSLQQIQDQKAKLEDQLRLCQQQISKLQDNLLTTQEQIELDKTSSDKQNQDNLKALLAKAIEQSQTLLKEALEHADNPNHHGVTCTAEYLLSQVSAVEESVSAMAIVCQGSQSSSTNIYKAVEIIGKFAHVSSHLIVHGFATVHASANVEQSVKLSTECRTLGTQGLQILQAVDNWQADPQCIQVLHSTLKQIRAISETLLPNIEDVNEDAVENLVEAELLHTTDMIEQAARRIQDMLDKSRTHDTGIHLQVNENILDSCNALMLTIRALILKAKVLQQEIVDNGRGTDSLKEFYKKHNRWTDGLLSAAKAVGWGANVLVEAADKVVQRKGKFEELVVCSQEIAASTAQLVVSSKVKANRSSNNLRDLATASKDVTQATANVVASAKAGAQMVEEQDLMNFSALTLHQAKRLEMESQVRTLELESDLERERQKLSELRKVHYRLAGESEGWTQEGAEATKQNGKNVKS